jgi:hypothetical protein
MGGGGKWLIRKRKKSLVILQMIEIFTVWSALIKIEK